MKSERISPICVASTLSIKFAFRRFCRPNPEYATKPLLEPKRQKHCDEASRAVCPMLIFFIGNQNALCLLTFKGHIRPPTYSRWTCVAREGHRGRNDMRRCREGNASVGSIGRSQRISLPRFLLQRRLGSF